jgi:predicted nucleic acid-binding protein
MALCWLGSRAWMTRIYFCLPGIEITRAQDLAKASQIEQWLDQVAGSYNIVPMDAAVLRMWAKLMHKTSDTLMEDAMIAATAKVHQWVVVTRNVADFKSFRVDVLNPFGS